MAAPIDAEKDDLEHVHDEGCGCRDDDKAAESDPKEDVDEPHRKCCRRRYDFR